jgi:predicted acetyltransferase
MEDPEASTYGLHRDGRLACAMRVHRYRMTFGAVQQVPVHGLAGVAVDLAHKKEKLGKMLVEEFLAICARDGAPLAALYPFRADFYKRMGFGMGGKKSIYSLPPSAFPLPDGSPKVRLRRAGLADDRALCACYNRFAARRHGMFERSPRDFERLLGDHSYAFVHEQDSRVTGYVVFTFHRVNPENSLTNDLQVQEWLYEDPRALRALCGFFAAQSDQVRRVVLPTQDPAFYHLFLDPRDDSDRQFFHAQQSDVSGVGIMYRVVDPAALLGRLRFGPGRARVRLTVRDPLLQPAERQLSVSFADGRATVDDQPAELKLALGLADFSSWIVGAVSLRALCGYGLADLSAPERADELDRIVLPVEPPMCLTQF